MRYLVIGGGGFLGQRICKLLNKSGAALAVYDNFSSTDEYLVYFSEERITVYQNDVRSSDDLFHAVSNFKPDVILYLAAVHYIPYCLDHPNETIDINVGGLQNTINAIAAQNSSKPPLLFLASSAAVYGKTKQLPHVENHPTQPCDIYGESKALAEKIAKESRNPYIIGRLYNLYGPNDPHSHLIPVILKQLNNSRNIKLGNNTSKRDFLHVNDAAAAIVELVQHGKQNEVYNIGSGISVAVSDVVNTVTELWGGHQEITYQHNARSNDPNELRADISKLHRETNWRQSTNFHEGIEELVRRMKSGSK